MFANLYIYLQKDSFRFDYFYNKNVIDRFGYNKFVADNDNFIK